MMTYTKWIVGLAFALTCFFSQYTWADVNFKWNLKWKAQELTLRDFPIKLTPVSTSKVVYLADTNGVVIARDAQSGRVLWHNKTHLKLISGPFYQNNTLFFGSQEGKLIAVDTTHQGKILWKTSLSSEILASPKANNDFVFVNTMDGKLYALNIETGHIVWSFDRNVPQLILRQASAPVVQEGIVLSGFSSGKIVAFDAYTGALIWEKMVSTPKGHSELDRMVDISADLLTENQIVFSSAFQGKTVGINIQSGLTLWEREIDTQHNMALDQGVLYLTDNKNVLWALDTQTGTTLWRQENLQKNALTGPAVMGDILLVGSLKGQVLIFDKKDGRLLGKKQFKNHHFTQSPVIEAERAYILSKEGKLSAIRIQF